MILLTIYDFCNTNNTFRAEFSKAPPAKEGNQSPLESYLSLVSHLFQHSFRSMRATNYSLLALYTLQLLVEDPVSVGALCHKDSQLLIHFCRQKPPHLPLVRGKRPAACAIMDMVVDAINHNLRRKLDITLYQ